MPAGMGRAPATAVAYMAWIRGIPVDEAYEMMSTVRRCRWAQTQVPVKLCVWVILMGGDEPWSSATPMLGYRP